MELQLFFSLWGHPGFSDPIAAAVAGGFAGVEGPVPSTAMERAAWKARLAQAGLGYIAEICTAGSYIPRPHASMNEHLDSFRENASAALECSPLFVTVVGGQDSWPLAASVDFIGQCIEFADQQGFVVSFETHRSRSLHSPWPARELLRQLPALRLTCDFAHWCCVCERLILDEEPELLALCAARAQHIHARVGYAQGPQVPHPAAPEYADALDAHERWWKAIWTARETAGCATTTITPEFGPDGYLHTLPFTGEPVGDVAEMNRWIAQRLRQSFAPEACSAAA